MEFWTFGCYNCRNVEPYVKAWHQKYSDKGLVAVGVHALGEGGYQQTKQQIRALLEESSGS